MLPLETMRYESHVVDGAKRFGEIGILVSPVPDTSYHCNVTLRVRAPPHPSQPEPPQQTSDKVRASVLIE